LAFDAELPDVGLALALTFLSTDAAFLSQSTFKLPALEHLLPLLDDEGVRLLLTSEGLSVRPLYFQEAPLLGRSEGNACPGLCERRRGRTITGERETCLLFLPNPLKVRYYRAKETCLGLSEPSKELLASRR
jgi:hypothetical protein